MRIPIDNDLMLICKEIVDDDNSEEAWAGMESGDMFQQGRYCGGFDADDMFFAFSYDDEGEQWCLSLTLKEVQEVVAGIKKEVQVDRWDELMRALEE